MDRALPGFSATVKSSLNAATSLWTALLTVEESAQPSKRDTDRRDTLLLPFVESPPLANNPISPCADGPPKGGTQRATSPVGPRPGQSAPRNRPDGRTGGPYCTSGTLG